MAAQIRHLDKTGVTVITAKDWGDAFAGVTQTAEKFAIQNVGSRDLLGLIFSIEQVGTNDGDQQERWRADSAGAGQRTVVPPYEVEAVVAADAGIFAGIGTYGYVVTAINATGETGPSLEVTAIVDVVTKNVTLTWTKPSGPAATGFKVYRTPTPASYGVITLLAVLGDVDTYVDVGGFDSGLQTIDVVAAAKTFTRSSGSFITDGFLPGMTIVSTGFTNGGNNATKVIQTVTATVITVTSDTGLVDESGGGDEEVVSTTTGTGGPPSANTTGGAPSAYGTVPGSLVTTDLAVGDLKIGQQFVYWVNRVIPLATPEAGNPRLAELRLTET